MYVKTIRRPLHKTRIEAYREGEHVDIAIMRDGNIKVQEIILRRGEIAKINQWINGR